MAIGEGGIPGAGKTRRSFLGRGWRRFGRSRFVQRLSGNAAAAYIRLVRATNRLVQEGPVDYRTADIDRPLILTMWHGQHLLLPAVRRNDHRIVALISRHRDGEVQAIAARRLGVETVRGSAAREPDRVLEQGGVSGFLKLRAALRERKSVTLTADLSKQVARKAGMGVIRLAQASGAPIVPLALATSRRRTIGSWDRTSLNLPFGRMAFVIGNFVDVPADADEAQLEEKRRELEAELNRVTDRAYLLADRTHG